MATITCNKKITFSFTFKRRRIISFVIAHVCLCSLFVERNDRLCSEKQNRGSGREKRVKNCKGKEIKRFESLDFYL